jgi:hypothetical protein
MQISFRHSNYKATLSQPSDDENLIHDFVQPDNPLPSNHPISKCVTSKAIIRPAPAADDSDFYDDDYRDDEELTIFEEDDDELAEFDGDDEELIIFDEEDDELTVLDGDDEEDIAPDPGLTVQDETPTDDETGATVLNWQNPYPCGTSSSYFQQCSYWNK